MDGVPNYLWSISTGCGRSHARRAGSWFIWRICCAFPHVFCHIANNTSWNAHGLVAVANVSQWAHRFGCGKTRFEWWLSNSALIKLIQFRITIILFNLFGECVSWCWLFMQRCHSQTKFTARRRCYNNYNDIPLICVWFVFEMSG